MCIVAKQPNFDCENGKIFYVHQSQTNGHIMISET